MVGSIVQINLIFYLLLSVFVVGNGTEDPWSFIVIADWHQAEPFPTEGDNATIYDELSSQVHYVREKFGGDLVVLPGDSNSGHWTTEEFAENFRPELKIEERVLLAGRNCYGTMKKLFTEAGYQHVLIAVGDHELGDNDWNSHKVKYLRSFRQGFAESFNLEPTTGDFLFDKNIRTVPSRPLETPYRQTSYAYQHKNVLFITLDVFALKKDDFMDKKKGLGGWGRVTGTVTGSEKGGHLKWFEDVLREANKIDTVKHIIVQAHLPVIHPVRNYQSSGMFIDHGEDSNLWKAMVKYGVDIYLAGEVHSTTVTKARESDLLQIASRGNFLSNLLAIEVTDDVLNITSYKSYGRKSSFDENYVAFGNLIVKKTICNAIDKEINVMTRDFAKENNNDGERSRTAFIMCGSRSGSCSKRNPKRVSVKTKHQVRCCSDSRMKSPQNQKKKNCPYAATCLKKSIFYGIKFGGWKEHTCKGLCSGKVTYRQAKIICAKAGGNICTKSQLSKDCATGSGCKYESEMVWAKRDPFTESPSTSPRASPSNIPSLSPSNIPSRPPSDIPSLPPSNIPSRPPSDIPSLSPSNIPSRPPSDIPSLPPSNIPSLSPSDIPSLPPSDIPSLSPSDIPSLPPSNIPSLSPSKIPSLSPSNLPSFSSAPTVFPRCTDISSSGVLELLDRSSALIHFNFNESIPMRNPGMQYSNPNRTYHSEIRGINCTKSLPNHGSLGRT